MHHRTTLRSAFTPLDGATMLHIAAEHGNLAATTALLANGADVNARADFDGDGLNGHTPIFRTVNSNVNRSALLMALLLAHGARTDALLAGITRGRGFLRATICLDLTPISHAQLGNLR